MKKSPPWQMVLRSYRNSEYPEQRMRCRIWQAAMGLQGVDGLNPSGYLVSLAEKHILGKLTLEAMEKRLLRYYFFQKYSRDFSEESREADLVSLHIAALLSDRSFRFCPGELKKIHHRLFENVFDFAGNYRDYDIRKQEWILRGESVSYADCDTIEGSLQAVFAREQGYPYQGTPAGKAIPHLARFIAAVWLIHPYGEGNTRTTALFLIRYLQSLGLRFRPEVFLDAWYFRNALVRACYEDPETGVKRDFQYLERFLQNLLLRKDHPLRNQELHLDYPNI